ncbi:hypothetical protein SAMD00019534_092220 [Acytostelium subglobosum LB1]|uniref:hypothetical protein n=1 Tax=Acytostelium subglobosum LB1 TaxID=1410327 RepID=UPI000644941A|nr:hypothetical protein SAMD00019534_092220 [Acytostelium subglobosum LB1]GAM26047.1 hypothetical protein SAMD00019534_092220 [Acytostelium subglobosum LB1]|eukprot:XP_012751090.1 hypothetical protein SAMD00019534_092220 [Acytostelium subglobosum LB1]
MIKDYDDEDIDDLIDIDYPAADDTSSTPHSGGVSPPPSTSPNALLPNAYPPSPPCTPRKDKRRVKRLHLELSPCNLSPQIQVNNTTELECIESITSSTRDTFFPVIIQSLIKVLGTGKRISIAEMCSGMNEMNVILQHKGGQMGNMGEHYTLGSLNDRKDATPYLEDDLFRIPLVSSTLCGEIQIQPINAIEMCWLMQSFMLRFIVRQTMYETERRIHESLLFTIVECSTSSSEDFFHLLSKQLCHSFNAKYSGVCKLISSVAAINICFASNTSDLESRTFYICNGPCKMIYDEKKIVFFDDVQNQFPQEPFFASHGISSYMGFPLIGSMGQVIGHIFLMGERPFNPVVGSSPIISAISKRASVEVERRKVQEELLLAEILLDQFPACVFLVNKHGVIIREFGNTDSILGVRETCLGKNVSSFERGKEEIYRHLCALDAANQPENIMVKDIRLTKGNNEEMLCEIFLREIFDHNGYSLGIMLVIRDITEAKQIQHSLEQANLQLCERNNELIETRDRALKAIQMKSQFMATISHEIRTPMNGVIGMAEMLLTTNLTPEQFEIADTIYKSGELLLSITSDILDFSKIEASKLELEMIEFDFMGCIEGVFNTLSISLEKKIEIILLFEKDVPTKLIGDPNRLRQIILNIGSNAIKYTDQGHIYGHVSVVERSRGKCKICVAIHDTGIGIETDKRALLFEPFSQLDASNTRKYGGSGLGLAICSRLAKLMDGEVTLEWSKAGKGSVFSLKAVFEEVEQPPMTPFTTELVRDPEPTVMPLCLIVDDYAFGSKVTVDKMHQLWVTNVHEMNSASLEEILYLSDSSTHNWRLMFASWNLHMIMIVHREHKDINTFIKLAADTAEYCKNMPVKVVLVTNFANSKLVPKTRKYILLTKPMSSINLLRIIRQDYEELYNNLGSLNEKSIRKQSLELLDNNHTTLKILLVEDNLVNRKVISMQLSKLGYECDQAEDGNEGFSKYKDGEYDLVFMDLTMPNCDGTQSSLMIRSYEQIANRPRVVIIALSATVLDGSKEFCQSMGMDDFLMKPLKMKKLKQVLESIKIKKQLKKSM